MGVTSLEEITYQNDNFDWFVRQVTAALPIFLRSMILFGKYLRKQLGVNFLLWKLIPVPDAGW